MSKRSPEEREREREREREIRCSESRHAKPYIIHRGISNEEKKKKKRRKWLYPEDGGGVVGLWGYTVPHASVVTMGSTLPPPPPP